MASADDLITSLRGISATTFSSESERIRARDALLLALRAVQSPWDLAWDHNWANPAISAAISALIHAGVFTHWAAEASRLSDDACPITPARLAALTGADELLLRRLLRAVSGQHLITEVGLDTYARTAWAKTLAADPAFPSMYQGFYHELNSGMFHSLPAHLKSTGFKNPSNVMDCNLQYWLKDPSTNLFQYIGTNSALTAHFNDAMECHSKYNLTPWVDVYPTDAAVSSFSSSSSLKDGRPLVVDIGGGKGHDLKKFLDRHPSIPEGSLILQDLPDILKTGVVEEKAIRVQPHDFFTPQPEGSRGAKLYFMHNVLHDWPDEAAKKILETLAPAMEKEYSRLLIHESLVSSEKPLSRVTVSDITMMACLGAAERSEKQWEDLVASAGLRVVKMWRTVESVETIVEAERV